MFKIIMLSSLLACASSSLFSQKKVAYQLFQENGKRVNYKKLQKKAVKADIILFGEHHNNPICHWLQLELIQDAEIGAIGMEMFERDDQASINQYLKSEITEPTFAKKARFWSNYETDYKPIVEYAKSKQLPVIATNIPRRYASMVFKGGFEVLDTLSDEEKVWVAPIPIQYDKNLPGYQKMLEMMPGGHGGENFPKAQAIKDATMAYSILEQWKKGQLFIHINGSYHSDNFEGILWYLRQAKPDLNYLTITTVEQEQLKKLADENKGVANFMLCVPSTMTKTY